jgi:tetratricopeptide (TPR) repeat protein
MTDKMRKLKFESKSALLCMLLFLAACGSPQPRVPVLVDQTRQTELAAHRAMREGDLARARELFSQSLLLQQSLDNAPGAAMDAINLATIFHKQGDDKTALLQLDRILADGAAGYPPELRAAAAFRQAVILADGGEKNQIMAVASALQMAENECPKPCAYAPGIANLRARLALQKGDYTTALKLAKVTLDAAGNEKEELANARRISAAAEMALGRHELALAHFMAALDLDKALGISSRIVLDLNGISRVYEQLGRKSEAESYARRASAVIEAKRSLAGGAMKKTVP